MDMTGVYACLFEAVCDVTTVPSHLKRAALKAAALKKLGYRVHVNGETMSQLKKTLLCPCLEYASGANLLSQTAVGSSVFNCAAVARAVIHQRWHPPPCKSKTLKLLGWPTLAWRRRRAKLMEVNEKSWASLSVIACP